jgi:hypothetical protein
MVIRYHKKGCIDRGNFGTFGLDLENVIVEVTKLKTV